MSFAPSKDYGWAKHCFVPCPPEFCDCGRSETYIEDALEDDRAEEKEEDE